MAYLSQFLQDGVDIKSPVVATKDSSESFTPVVPKAGYSAKDRMGATENRTSTEALDTTNYDARINEAQNALNEASKDAHKYFTPKQQREDTKGYEEYKQKVNAANAALQQANAAKSNYQKNNLNRNNLSGATTAADQALKSAQIAESGTAQANKKANINAGINRSQAGLLGSNNAAKQAPSVQNAQYFGNRSTAASTQADYLEKMASANALDQQASNMGKSASLAGVAGALTGAGSGAALGATISDENCKDAPSKEPCDGIDTDELLSSVQQFMDLYAKVKELRGDK